MEDTGDAEKMLRNIENPSCRLWVIRLRGGIWSPCLVGLSMLWGYGIKGQAYEETQEISVDLWLSQVKHLPTLSELFISQLTATPVTASWGVLRKIECLTGARPMVGIRLYPPLLPACLLPE